MTRYTLKFACPDNPTDCLAKPLLPLLQSPPWIAYLTLDDLYLSDVNDDPNLENEYEAGLDIWTVCVQTLSKALNYWSRGTPVRICLYKQSKLSWLVDKLTDRVTEIELIMKPSPLIDPEFVQSMTTYGWKAVIWTALSDGEDAAISPGSVTMADLERLVRESDVPWWLSHGYKEPFLVGHTPSLTIAAVADLVRKEASIPVQIAEEPFVPHRVRMHRRWTA